MQANELRLGNMLAWTRGAAFGVFPADPNIIAYCAAGEQDKDKYQPCKLTKEWIGRFGFAYNEQRSNQEEGCDVYWNDDEIEVHDYGTHFEYDPKSFNSKNGGLRIKYVHELQNIHFAIWGEELTYTPD